MNVKEIIAGAALSLARIFYAVSLVACQKDVNLRTLNDSLKRAFLRTLSLADEERIAMTTLRHELEATRREAERLSYKLACERRRAREQARVSHSRELC